MIESLSYTTADLIYKEGSLRLFFCFKKWIYAGT